MSFYCQKFCYLTKFNTTVVSCTPGKNCYEVILEDTILFPEGGGQPWDLGKIDDAEVSKVERRGGVAVHTTDRPLEVGKEVSVEVDWTRRFDHMQQHSAQHLITAITDQMYGFETTSWCLAVGQDRRCFIELGTSKLSNDQMAAIEDRCNECIRQHIPMTPRWFDADSAELKQIRTRGLPDDVTGQVRVVDIEGIDSNMCCGTHVSNLADLQSIKLLGIEMRKGVVLLQYVAGNRVLNYLARTLQLERDLTKLLCTGPKDYVTKVDKILQDQKRSNKVISNQLRELAQLQCYKHLHTTPVDPVAVMHNKDGDNIFMNIIADELTSHGVTVFVSVGADTGAGKFLLAGEEKVVSDLGPKVAAILEGKGGGRKGCYQGKGNKIEERDKVEKLLRETLT